MRYRKRLIGSADKKHIMLFSGEGTTMIMREWGEMRQLYFACSPGLTLWRRATQPAWVYWPPRSNERKMYG
jgi:hypothetical protein